MSTKDDVTLTNPRLHVIMNDGSHHEVQAANPDLIRWDLTKAKQRWPGVQEAPFLWMTFIAWAALRRESIVTDTWEVFSDRCIQVSDVSDPSPDGDDAVRPTQPTADPVLSAPSP